MDQRDAPQKRDAIFRSPIDTTTPRLQPDHHRYQSFSSTAYSPAVSPSFSDHSTSRGFFSPRGGENEDEDEVDNDGDEDVDEELHEVDVDERGYLYRPRSPPVVELPVISTVSRSVRVEPKVVTRVDSGGVKERVFVERRVVEDGGLDFGGGRGSARRKWEGRNTVLFDSGLKEKEVVVPERIFVEEESVEFRGRQVFDFGQKEKEVVPERRVVEEESVEFGDRRGRKSEGKNAIVFDSGVQDKEVARGQRVGEEGNVGFRDGRVRKWVGKNVSAFNSGVKEKEVAREQRVVEEGSVELRDGRGDKSELRNAVIVDSSPIVVYSSRPKEEVAGIRTEVYDSGRKEEEVLAGRVVEGGDGGGEGGEGVKPSLRRRQEGRRSQLLVMRKAALWFRVLGLVMCLISFSIMAANKNKGWALDSFDRYKEFRYCMAVSVLGFVYSAVQACNVAYHLGTDKYSNQHNQLRYYLDFFMDQALSYLLISASSSAATRVEDWVSNWGRDKFPQMASASVIVSFLAFVAFAFSSLVSGYTLCAANVP